MRKKKTKKADFELIPKPSGLARMTKADLIEQIEFLIKISNLALEGKAKDRLAILDKEIALKIQESHLTEMKCREQELKRQILNQKEQLSDFKTELSKSEDSFSLNALPI